MKMALLLMLLLSVCFHTSSTFNNSITADAFSSLSLSLSSKSKSILPSTLSPLLLRSRSPSPLSSRCQLYHKDYVVLHCHRHSYLHRHRCGNNSFRMTTKKLSSLPLSLRMMDNNENSYNNINDDDDDYYDKMEHLEELVYASSLSYLESTITVPSSSSSSSKVTTSMENSPYFVKANRPTNDDGDFKFALLEQVVDPISESGATIFRSTKQSETTFIVAFRGSATPKNFVTNLKFNLVPVSDELLLLLSSLDSNNNNDSKSNNDEQYKVHTGFQDASIGLWNIVEPKLETVLQSQIERNNEDDSHMKMNKIRLIFTGHSLGGAIAQLCGIQYNQKNKNQNKASSVPLTGIVTFGGPRIVNTAFANYVNTKQFNLPNNDDDNDSSNNKNEPNSDNKKYDGSTTTTIRNYVHNKDPILRQNGPLWDKLGFGLIGQEVLCEHDQPIVYNDKKNQDTNLPLPIAWNIIDHCQYLGTYVGPRLL